eukprot:scaffold269953_cov66-Attheya_sp.AAC.2
MEKQYESGITTSEQVVNASGIKMCTNAMVSHHTASNVGEKPGLRTIRNRVCQNESECALGRVVVQLYSHNCTSCITAAKARRVSRQQFSNDRPPPTSVWL